MKPLKININKIPLEGLPIEGTGDAAMLELSDPLIRSIGPVNFSLDVGLSGTGLFATGRLSVDLEMECVGCLERFVYPLAVEDFAMQTELEGAETADLTPYVREDILLALPNHPRCDWDGRKVCEGALKGAAVLKKRSEPAPQAAEAWGELDKLKLKKRK